MSGTGTYEDFIKKIVGNVHGIVEITVTDSEVKLTEELR